MGYPFSEGAKATVTIGSAKFELFTKEEGAFVEKPEMETKLIDAMKGGTTMKIQGKSARGTATTDTYSLSGLSEALDRAAKECGG
jgi:invasion protein IalB